MTKQIKKPKKKIKIWKAKNRIFNKRLEIVSKASVQGRNKN